MPGPGNGKSNAERDYGNIDDAGKTDVDAINTARNRYGSDEADKIKLRLHDATGYSYNTSEDEYNQIRAKVGAVARTVR